MKMNVQDAMKAVKAVNDAAIALDIPHEEAAKAKSIPHENVKVVEKLTADNFYRQPRFWVGVASTVGAVAAGEYGNAISLVMSLFGFSFGAN